MTKLDLSIIIISFNTKEILVSSIKSIIRNTSKIKYEIIVVDNGSTDGSIEAISKLAKTYSQVKLVDAGGNLGFGRGNNLGVKHSSAEYLLFLNSDTLIFDNAISNSLNNFKKLTKVGAYTCQLLNADRTNQPSGGYFPNLFNLYAWQLFIDDLPIFKNIIKSFHPHTTRYGRDIKLDWITGAFMIVKKSVFEKSGSFDENIFMYTEEMELCYRLSLLGYKTVYDPSSAIIHLGGASGGSYLALTSEIKNMIYFWKKHLPGWQVPLAKLAFALGSLLRLIIFGIIKGDKKSRHTYADALKLTL